MYQQQPQYQGQMTDNKTAQAYPQPAPQAYPVQPDPNGYGPPQPMYYETVIVQQQQPMYYSNPTPQYQQPMQQNNRGDQNVYMRVHGQTGSVLLKCPSCKQSTQTKTKCAVGQKQWTICFILCIAFMFGCPPCCCLPCLVPSCYEYRHTCGNCSAYIGNSRTGN